MGAKQKKQIARLQEKIRQCERYKTAIADCRQLHASLDEARLSLEKEKRDRCRLGDFISEAAGSRIRIDKDTALRMRYDVMAVRMEFCPRMLEYNFGSGNRMSSLTHTARMVSHEIERQVFDAIMKELTNSSIDNRMAGIW